MPQRAPHRRSSIVAISPTGRVLAAASSDETIRLWDMTTGSRSASRWSPRARASLSWRSARTAWCWLQGVATSSCTSGTPRRESCSVSRWPGCRMRSAAWPSALTARGWRPGSQQSAGRLGCDEPQPGLRLPVRPADAGHLAQSRPRQGDHVRRVRPGLVDLLLQPGAGLTYPSEVAGEPGRRSKANGKLRMCIDYTDLNKACPKDPYPLPRIDQIVDSTAGVTFCVFFALELRPCPPPPPPPSLAYSPSKTTMVRPCTHSPEYLASSSTGDGEIVFLGHLQCKDEACGNVEPVLQLICETNLLSLIAL